MERALKCPWIPVGTVYGVVFRSSTNLSSGADVQDCHLSTDVPAISYLAGAGTPGTRRGLEPSDFVDKQWKPEWLAELQDFISDTTRILVQSMLDRGELALFRGCKTRCLGASGGFSGCPLKVCI